MKLAVVAYPKLDEADRVRIEAFRTKHDPQAPRLAVHVTLVFPVVTDLIELEDEIALVAKSTQPISFTIRGTRAVRDVLTTESHVVLVPEEGSADVTMLHDRFVLGCPSAALAFRHPVCATYDGRRVAKSRGSRNTGR